MAQVFECNTAQDIWNRLHSLFQARSNAQIVQTRLQLASLKKGSESISEYFNKAKALVSTIQSAGQLVSDDEFVVYVFAGLCTDYDSIVSSRSTQPVLPPPEQVLFYLMNHEIRLARNSSTSILGAPPLSAPLNAEANFTSTRGGRGSFNGNNSGRGSTGGRGSDSGGRGGFNNSYGRSNGGRGGSTGRGRGGSFTFSGDQDNRPVCQLCERRDHTAMKCWHRFDQSFQAPPPRSFQAHTTTSSWYPDTAANHHFIPDLSNLRLDNLSYSGTDQVSLGDGSTVPIRNSDQSPPPFGPC